MSRSPYLEDILISSRRILTHLNRNNLEITSGCFDRDYWHFKKTDFPSAIKQMGIGILAKLYCLEGTDYFKSKQILNYIEHAISFTARIQKNDGSFDEWYFNERGWAGPTGYLLNAFLDTYELIGDELESKSKKLLKRIILKGLKHLEQSTEKHVLTNHIAIALLPMIQANHLLKIDNQSQINQLIADIKKNMVKNEGWSLEYDGADPGYQSGTLSFLSKALKYGSYPDLEKICADSLEFISYFAFPSGTIAGNLGSRATINFFVAGIEAHRDKPLGKRLARFIREGILTNKVILASDLDDFYVYYRLFEFLDAHKFQEKKESESEKLLPYEGENFVKAFPRAGIRIGKTNNSYWGIALYKGGAVRIDNINLAVTTLIDNGIEAAIGNFVYTSYWQTNDVKVNETIDKYEISGNLENVTPKIFSPFTFILFRLFMILVGWNSHTSLFIKNSIRKILIFSSNKTQFNYSRQVSFIDNKVQIKTILNNCIGTKVKVGGMFWSRYVPQSRHFLNEDLEVSSPYYNVELHTDNKLEVVKSVDL